MKSKLLWKQLTDEGLLKEPEDCGPWDSRDSINGWNGFGTKEEAIAHLEEMKRVHKWGVHGDYVLVEVFIP